MEQVGQMIILPVKVGVSYSVNFLSSELSRENKLDSCVNN